MNILENITVNTIIRDSLKKAISYQDYRNLVKQLVDEKSTTGHHKTQDLVNYTMLNDRRMKRWDKTIKVSEDSKQRVSNFTGAITWLIITESWCGDAAHVIPALSKVAELSSNIDIKLVLRDENELLMNQFLTNGGRSIAKLIMIDNTTGDVITTYGPRPVEATKLVDDYKDKYGTLTPEFKENLQVWYNKDKGQSIIQDALRLLSV
jgi:thiol-disulfide isomerase/thioredoxin